jgi:sulfite exporter TauE/SafE
MIELLAGFSMGIAGAMHCLGMCGPLITITRASMPDARFVLPVVQHNVGRVMTYLVLAILLWFTKDKLLLGDVSQSVTIFIGVAMILLAMLQITYHKSLLPQSVLALIGRVVARTTSKVRGRQMLLTPFFLGLCNGLLPCGLSATAFIASLTLPQPWQVVLFIVGFGIGTSPGLTAFMLAGKSISKNHLHRIAKYSPVLIIVAGTLIVLRGLTLSIPMLSPSPQSTVIHGAQGCCGK